MLFRVVVGFIFLKSGFGMVLDPCGASHLLENLILGMGANVLLPLSLAFAIVIGAFKFSVGCCLLIGTNIAITSVYLIIFVLIEIVALLLGHVSGSWLVVRNVIFLFAGGLIFYWRKHSVKLYTKRTEWIIELYSFAFALCLAVHCYVNLPLIDTTVAKEGYPMKSALLDEAKAKNLDVRKIERDLSCLSDKGYSFVLLSRFLPDATTVSRTEINALYDYSRKHNYSFVCLMGEGATDIEVQEYVIESAGAEYQFVETDKQVIDFIARSNPELIILKDGKILRKFTAYKIPSLDDKLEEELYGKQSESSSGKTILMCFLAYIIPLLLVLAYDYLVELIKWLIKKYVMKS